MKAAELRQKDVAGVKEEVKALQKAHFGLRMQKAPNNSTIPRNCARPVEASHAPKPSLLKSKPLNKDNEDDGHQKIPQTHLDWQGGQ